MKNFERLDKIFDDALDRSSRGVLDKGLSDLGPLASDHMLLKKSWDFFKKKMAQMEDHFKDLLDKKDGELKAVSDAYRDIKTAHDQCDEKKQDEEVLEEAFVRQKLADFEAFKLSHQRMMEASAEERIKMEDAYRRLETQFEKEKQKTVDLRQSLLAARDSYKNISSRLELDKETLLRNRIENEKKLREELALLQEEISGRDAKIDLLKKEILVRDTELKRADDALRSARIELGGEKDTLSQLKNENMELNQKIAENRAEMKNLEEKMSQTKEAWQREQAQWRELWDRARELWDLKKKPPSSDPPASE